jgi:transposase InsO family protein
MGQESEATGRRYPLAMVCEVLEVPRSSFYALRRQLELFEPPAVGKRGPRPAVSDEALLAAIRADLEESPFHGEGHRKVWARLRHRKIRVSRKRVLRLMREHNLLAPVANRNVHGDPAHDGTIITDAPDLMWGTDGTRFFTQEEEWVWFFAAVDHFNSEVVGWTVVKIGDRWAALEPVRQGVTKHFGAIGADVARGLALRYDHGPQYMSDDFLGELRFLGISQSPAFVGEPQCNGVAERFMRTVKEQAIWGRRFQTIAEAKEVIGQFIETYNAEWRIERLGFRSPSQARAEYRRAAA